MSNNLCASVCLFVVFTQCAGCVTVPERVILLPQESGAPTTVVVQSKSGETAVLDRPYMVVTVTEKQVGREETDKITVQLRYKELFDALPATAKSYLLFFNTGSTQLRIASERTLQAMVANASELPAADVILIGHTDSGGPDTLNDDLSLQRALSVLALLKAKGINPRSVSTVGRGSRDPLVIAKKGVPVPMNRRVELIVK